MSKERFDRTVAILVKAYLDDTLIHGTCHACAVGNIVASVNDIKFIKSASDYGGIRWANGYPRWDATFCCDAVNPKNIQRVYPEEYKGESKEQIDSTGYAWQELARVEKAFESAPHEGDRMFNALMAVVSVLAEIDCISLEHTEQARKLFVR